MDTESIQIESPYTILQILFQRIYPGYIYRREVIPSLIPGREPEVVVNCYSSDTGHWIGDPRTARFLCITKGLRGLQKQSATSNICTIGFSEREQKWYGWSHRAIYGYGIGDIPRGCRTPLRSLRDAKKRAKMFAESVS